MFWYFLGEIHIKALFIATSPLQLICAAEAYNKYEIEEAHLVLKISSNAVANDVLKNTLAKYPFWKSVIEISKRHSFLDLVKALRKISGSRYDYVFNAEFNGWFQNVLLSNVHYDRRVIYDDGVMTINDYRVYFEPKQASQKKHWEKDFLLRLLGYTKTHLDQFEHIVLFTMFDLKPLPHVSITKNNFFQTSIERSHVKDVESGPIGVLGQPLVEVGIVSSKYYEDCLAQLASKGQIIYFAHRGETEDRLSKLKKIVGLTVVRESTPIELAIEKYQLRFMVGFISTALQTLSLLYPGLSIYFIRIPESEYLTKLFQVNCGETYGMLDKVVSEYSLA